ncbi:MAG: DNA polymerase I [Actinomycetota bacterium]|nr:DNA polymerase I [Actinomycetota bacterium]
MTPEPSTRDGRRLFLLDGHSLAYRAFFALPASLATSTGQITNAVYGFTSMLIKLLSEERPDMIAVAFDMGAPTVRLQMDAEYKAGRPETPSEFAPQLGLISEVLETLGIPIVRVEGHEADDALGTLAVRAAAAGIDATIVTADRDFFQLVRPGITVMFNRKGISDIVRYDESGVEERFGLPPAKYLEYVALKGDPSDNIPGVPGVGEKTATKLVQQFGSVEGILAHTDELKGRLRENVEAAADRLALNKDLARIVTDLELPLELDDLVMGEWDLEEIRRLFTSLEFRSLLDRLEEVGHTAKPKVEVAQLDLRATTPEELLAAANPGTPLSVRLDTDREGLHGAAVSAGGAQAAYGPLREPDPIAAWLADGGSPKWAHDAKGLEAAALASGAAVEGVAFDTFLAGYLLDPAAADYPLRTLCERYLGVDVLGTEEEEAEGQLFGEEPWRAVAAEAAAVALLAPVMGEQIDRQGLRSLLETVEMPLASVLGRMEARGVRLDVDYLQEMGESVRDRMATLRADVFGHAGEEFNLNSPPQLRVVLYEKLGLSPGKKTPKGQLSTDASVLEKLRDQHPVVDALLQWRELDKLNSTYLEALPRLIDPRDGRVHTSFNQAVAATGRLSSSNPNLQNIPVRSELGRQIRRAFVPGEPGQVLLCADYSQIELRILAHLSSDEGLREAFATGHDIHAATAARVFGLPEDAVDPALRSRAKMVNYGLAYGMNAWGLASRLDIAPDEAQEIMDAYFGAFPTIREYLDRQVDRAIVDGYTETLLGRRRYIPELQAANPRVRDLGRRMALNAPIQGSASDVFKVAMIAVDAALRDREDLGCRMLLTVHDELVFEVAADRVDEAGALVKERMETAVDLDVQLRADLGWGPDWSQAAPAGH